MVSASLTVLNRELLYKRIQQLALLLAKVFRGFCYVIPTAAVDLRDLQPLS